MLAGEVLKGAARRIQTMARNSHDAAVRTRTGGTKRAEPARARKERVTFQLPVGLIEKARDVVFFSRGLTMASFMEQALVAQLMRAEKKRGEPFPSRAGTALKTGRPLKA
jgi:hypothetical protein